MDLSNFSTTDLQNELHRRDDERKAKDHADRKRREISVTCPMCDGGGRTANGDTMRVATNEADPFVTCSLCHGDGYIKALKMEVK